MPFHLNMEKVFFIIIQVFWVALCSLSINVRTQQPHVGTNWSKRPWKNEGLTNFTVIKLNKQSTRETHHHIPLIYRLKIICREYICLISRKSNYRDILKQVTDLKMSNGQVLVSQNLNFKKGLTLFQISPSLLFFSFLPHSLLLPLLYWNFKTLIFVKWEICPCVATGEKNGFYMI